MIKNIIFDFDGVIVDSEILASKALSKYFHKIGYSFSEEKFYKFAGRKTIQVIDELSKEYNIKNKEKFLNEIFNSTNIIFKKELNLVHGFKEFIENSKCNHFIASNSNKERIIHGLKLVNLNDKFSSNKIFSFEMVENPKPSPDIYLKVIKDYNLNLNETVIIEDSAVGIKAGALSKAIVFGLIAGKHWHSKRDKNELYKNGAKEVFNTYNDLSKAIESF